MPRAHTFQPSAPRCFVHTHTHSPPFHPSPLCLSLPLSSQLIISQSPNQPPPTLPSLKNGDSPQTSRKTTPSEKRRRRRQRGRRSTRRQARKTTTTYFIKSTTTTFPQFCAEAARGKFSQCEPPLSPYRMCHRQRPNFTFPKDLLLSLV